MHVNPGASSSLQHASARHEPQLNELRDFHRRTSSTQQQVSALHDQHINEVKPQLNELRDFHRRTSSTQQQVSALHDQHINEVKDFPAWTFSSQQDESPPRNNQINELKDFYPRSSLTKLLASAPHESQLIEAKNLQNKRLEEDMTEIHLESSSSYQTSKQKLIVIISSSKDESLEKTPVDSETDLRNSTRAFSVEEEAQQPRNRSKMATLDLLRDRNVLMSSLCYSMAGLAFIITDELFPIFGATSVENGGLGFSSSKLGVILGGAGLVLCLYTLLLYPSVAKRFGPLYCFRYGILCSIPCWILFPTCSLLSATPLLQWVLIMFTMAVRSAVACTVFTGILILVSNSASSDNVGTVTGFSHSLCSFFRATGPALGGMIWSFASTKTFLFHQYLAWLFVVLLSLCTFGLSYALPKSLVYPKNKRVPQYSGNDHE
ncbi:hypothetical protein R1sor_018346 [Riccia sorocarpa]|uniref:Major facilitator superfamily (MFS) profile domain-containing protein n=1 Tax=Riccia sorocarpa TaxID=122646 RepID=A0ABD3IFN6_9MARC